ncbi:Bifunctional protein Aas [compost metagenome]
MPPHAVPKTSSGKIRRAACRERYEGGTLLAGAQAPWRQWLRLEAAGFGPRLEGTAQQLGAGLYGLYAWGLFVVFAALTWPLMALAPVLSRRVLRASARGLLGLAGMPLEVKGLEHLAGCGPCVLVMNHASYLDGLALEACLPIAPRYVAHSRFRERFFPRVFLKRLEAIFVAPKDQARGLEETSEALAALRRGEPVAFFPEGTFVRAPGLLPFRMGAFTVAAEAGAPVVPIAIRGTRRILRAHARWPSRGAIHVEVGAPIRPTGSDWAAALALREAAYAAIREASGEPPLAGPRP